MDLREFLRGLYNRGANPYSLTGKRDDTVDMVLALRNHYGTENPEVLMGNEQPPAPQQQEEPMSGGGRSGYNEIWRRFQEMNPNLDYDKVAAQAIAKGGGGGTSVPGGTFSQMPDTRPDAQSDEAFIQWANNFAHEQEFSRKTDPRSRAYDPEGAKLMIEEARRREEGRQQEFAIDLLNKIASGEAGSAPGGRIDPATATALMNVGVRVPGGAVNYTPSTSTYHEDVFKMRSKAIDFMQRAVSDPVLSSKLENDKNAQDMYEYNKRVYEITNKYFDQPEKAYEEIMKLEVFGPTNAEGPGQLVPSDVPVIKLGGR